MEHFTEEVIARANVIPEDFNESQEVGEQTILELYLDDDRRYRWYDETDGATEADGPSMKEAIAAARMKWPGFEIVEYRDETVENEMEIPDVYAADEVAALERDQAEI